MYGQIYFKLYCLHTGKVPFGRVMKHLQQIIGILEYKKILNEFLRSKKVQIILTTLKLGIKILLKFPHRGDFLKFIYFLPLMREKEYRCQLVYGIFLKNTAYHHIAHFKYIIFFNYTSIKLKKTLSNPSGKKNIACSFFFNFKKRSKLLLNLEGIVLINCG